ncbi:chlorophyllase/cutinase-like alpha/beta fold protein [Nakamurella sp.]|uniref:poly(ethylene terephthalate) hydrolase family protein n=1 Tax=Nakamurella sp. TaxID=1869182 RepID=UPI0037834680
MLTVEGAGPDLVVLLPGFMIAPPAYSTVARTLARAGPTVLVPQLYRRGLGVLAGRVDIADEAGRAADLVRVTAARHPGSRVHLAGHSRGGQAAWRAVTMLPAGDLPASLMVIDPVDGAGRAPSRPTSTAAPVTWPAPTLVVGAGVEGRCAPGPVNHRQFARANRAARHVVVDGLGHADLLDGRPRTMGRRLCGGGADPDGARGVLTALLIAWIAAVDTAADLPPVAGTTVLR